MLRKLLQPCRKKGSDIYHHIPQLSNSNYHLFSSTLRQLFSPPFQTPCSVFQSGLVCMTLEKKNMAGRILLLLLCMNAVSFIVNAVPQTCPADLGGKCAEDDDWEGEFFPGIPKIKYEGTSSKNPLAYKWYNAEEEILGKKMKDWLRFSVAFWHTFRGTGADPFGAPTKYWPWEDGTNSIAMAKRRMRANFEFINKLGVDRWCFHDRDIAPDGKTLEEANANLDEVVALAKELQGDKIRPLWGTAQLFMHPRYMHGGATSSEVGVYAYAAAQVKKAMEVTHYLGGENYVFWGGREGYQSLLNTDMERELDHLARFLEAAVAYKKKIGFNGTLLIEPKPQEPTKHQYDWDAATTANFLRKYGLLGEFKLNIECNHATLSGHSCHHDLETARINGLLGNIDANTGDPQIGWDTDQFMTDIGEATMVMLSVIRNGGLAPGGFNFDAKLRRESTDVEDLFIAHISGMDTLARGLRNAAKLIEDGSLVELVRKRYSSFDTEIGAEIEAGKADFEMLEKLAKEWGEPKVASAKQELAEMIFQSAL
ncbi:Xylose isomerase family protein isoform 1 [Theobroma cacao]|uniref:Xylose isomerase n=1 Tax=Theobroma cacao TaxID=3641 RepID=A0A061FT64_THECC|nr:Xylose isomerase family protein isoform 1 [Theobroma cacao]